MFISSGNQYHLSIVVNLHLRFLFCFLFLLTSYYLLNVRSFTYIIWCPKNKKIFWLLVSSGGCRCRCEAGLSSFYTHTFCSPTKRSPHRMNGYPCRLWVPKITQELVTMLGSSLKMETPSFCAVSQHLEQKHKIGVSEYRTYTCMNNYIKCKISPKQVPSPFLSCLDKLMKGEDIGIIFFTACPFGLPFHDLCVWWDVWSMWSFSRPPVTYFIAVRCRSQTSR